MDDVKVKAPWTFAPNWNKWMERGDGSGSNVHLRLSRGPDGSICINYRSRRYGGTGNQGKRGKFFVFGSRKINRFRPRRNFLLFLVLRNANLRAVSSYHHPDWQLGSHFIFNKYTLRQYLNQSVSSSLAMHCKSEPESLFGKFRQKEIVDGILRATSFGTPTHISQQATFFTANKMDLFITPFALNAPISSFIPRMFSRSS